MKEIVIISGKGGTGKTSITGSLAALASKPVLADCDVDAADLHLILQPEVQETHSFSGGKQASIDTNKCIGCGKCVELCRFGAIHPLSEKDNNQPTKYSVDSVGCEGCGVCAWFCPAKAISFEEVENGKWFVSNMRFGPIVHAKLGIAEENSGKLVTLVRNKAKMIAEEQGRDFIIVDGSPGIGCPVIASFTGADLVVVVTEPTVSGEHDLDRVADLAAGFQIPVAVCVNKSDINLEITERIRQRAIERGLTYVGSIPYDKVVTDAQIAQKTIVEFDSGKTSSAIKILWERILEIACKEPVTVS